MTSGQAATTLAVATIVFVFVFFGIMVASYDSPDASDWDILSWFVLGAVIIFAAVFTKKVDDKFIFRVAYTLSMAQAVIVMLLWVIGLFNILSVFALILVLAIAWLSPVSMIALVVSIAFFVRNRRIKNLIPIGLLLAPIVISYALMV